MNAVAFAQVEKLIALEEFCMPAKEKNSWPVCFLIAGVFHLVILLGSRYVFTQPPEYGMMGTAASMEIYMVAALPKPVQTPVTHPVRQENKIKLPEIKSEMEVVSLKEQKLEQKRLSNEPSKLSKEKLFEKAKVKGDGSSSEAGESVTSFFSRGSSATKGREGKYKNPPPQYPSLAEERGWQGVVMLSAFVQREGEPSEVLVDQSSGYKILDEAALKAVRKWKFTSAHRGGQTVSAWIKIPIRFELESAKKS